MKVHELVALLSAEDQQSEVVFPMLDGGYVAVAELVTDTIAAYAPAPPSWPAGRDPYWVPVDELERTGNKVVDPRPVVILVRKALEP